MIKLNNYSRIIFVFLLLIFTSCTQYEANKIKAPKDLINIESFKSIMLDMRMTEVIIRQDITKSTGNKSKEITRKHYKNLFKKHHVSQERFQSSLLYYTNNPKLLNEINNAVVDSLNILREKIKPKE